MKTLFKTLILALLVSICADDLMAQSRTMRYRRLNLNLGPEFALPVGNFGNTNNFGYGGSVQLAVPFGLRGFIIGHVGYTWHRGSRTDSSIADRRFPNAQLIPYRAGYRFRLFGDFYVAAQAGAMNRIIDGNGVTAFSYAGGIGIANRRVDFGLRYDRSTFGSALETFNLRLAYVFGTRLGADTM